MSNQLPTLFRPEVLHEQKTRWLGPVLLVPKPSHRVFTWFAVVATVAVLALLFFGVYPRKAHVTGLLVPEGGLLRVFAPQPGVVTETFVREGARVKKGDPLLSLSTELQSANAGASGAESARRLKSRRESLEAERTRLRQLADQQQRSLSERLAAADAEEKKLESEIALQRVRVGSQERTVARQRALRKEGLASDEHVQSAQEGSLEQVTKLRELERDKLAAERNRLTIEGELADLPIKSQTDIGVIERQMASVEQELVEVEAHREITIPAPQSGTVTAFQGERGGHPDTKVPLLAIVPDGAGLEAHLYCPSRAVGFVSVGQRVLLRYQAFPYQKFGHYDGTVVAIAQSALNPTELPPELAGLTSVVGHGEPIYRVTVRLAKASVTAYGREIPLQPGQQLEADIVLERRRIFEWMLEPLFTITGTWKR